MLAYRLRHRVTFESYTEGGRDPVTGYPVPAGWAPVTADGLTLIDVPAEVLTGPGKEPHIAQADWGELSARVNTRWFPADEIEMLKWRIVWVTANGTRRVYDIDSVEADITARREWRLRCKGGLTDG